MLILDCFLETFVYNNVKIFSIFITFLIIVVYKFNIEWHKNVINIMKFLTLFKIILISNVCILYGYTEKIGESPSDRYESVINNSISYIQYFFSVLNELEDLRNTTHELVCGIDKKVRILELNQGSKNVKDIQKIINRLEYLSKRLRTQMEEWEDQFSQEDISISVNINNKARIGDYKTTIKNLIKLYGYIVKLITKFNTLKDQTERHIENVSHDIGNINTTMEDKEKITKDIHHAITRLTKELKTLTKVTLSEITNCKKQLEDINKRNSEINRINIKMEDNKNKKSKINEQKEETATSDSKDKSETNEDDNTKESDSNNSDHKEEEQDITLDDITDEEIIEYFRSRKSKEEDNDSINDNTDNNSTSSHQKTNEEEISKEEIESEKDNNIEETNNNNKGAKESQAKIDSSDNKEKVSTNKTNETKNKKNANKEKIANIKESKGNKAGTKKEDTKQQKTNDNKKTTNKKNERKS